MSLNIIRAFPLDYTQEAVEIRALKMSVVMSTMLSSKMPCWVASMPSVTAVPVAAGQ
jgi:hypothetical protein